MNTHHWEGLGFHGTHKGSLKMRNKEIHWLFGGFSAGMALGMSLSEVCPSTDGQSTTAIGNLVWVIATGPLIYFYIFLQYNSRCVIHAVIDLPSYIAVAYLQMRLVCNLLINYQNKAKTGREYMMLTKFWDPAHNAITHYIITKRICDSVETRTGQDEQIQYGIHPKLLKL